MLEIQETYINLFRETKVLKGVSLSVRQGDVVVILGPSGSGKTTLLRSLNFWRGRMREHWTGKSFIWI